ncbi:MAG: hypothetical protein K8U57_06925 [Planctomycetes bacterium]|nr:hypothetical protein [Planctomycetota bacterium]
MSESNPLTDYKHLKYDSLLQAWREAGSSARFAFLMINIAVLVIVTSQVSAYFPWARTTLARLSAASREVKPDSPEGREVDSRRQLYEAIVYRELGVNTVPILGLKYSVDDLQVLAAVGLGFLAVWYYLALCRVNRVVRHLCAAIGSEPDPDAKQYLYHGFAHGFLLFPARYTGLLPTITTLVVVWGPAWVPFVCIAIDVYSLFLPHLSGSQTTLWEALAWGERAEVLVRFGFSTGVMACSFFLVRACLRLVGATRQLLEVARKDARIPDLGDDPLEVPKSATATG